MIFILSIIFLEKKYKISENEVKRLLFIKIKRIYIESYKLYRYQHFYIDDNLKLKSLNPLINCNDLEIITLFDQDIFDFDLIDSFKHLKELTITYNDKVSFENKIENFSKINNLHHLKYLYHPCCHSPFFCCLSMHIYQYL